MIVSLMGFCRFGLNFFFFFLNLHLGICLLQIGLIYCNSYFFLKRKNLTNLFLERHLSL